MAGGGADRSSYGPARAATRESTLLVQSEPEDNPPDALHRSTRRKLAGLSFCLLLGVAGVSYLGVGGSGSKKLSVNPKFLELKIQELQEPCGLIEPNVDYSTNNFLFMAYPILDARSCQSKCINEPKCVAWTWSKQRGVKGLSYVCMLKGLQPGELPLRGENEGIVSGLVCPEQRRSHDTREGRQQATTTAVSAVANAHTATSTGRPTTVSAVATAAECSTMERNTEYWTSKVIGKLANIVSADVCRVHCEGDPHCSIWTWIQRLSGVEAAEEICWLRRLEEGELLKKRQRAGAFSGCTRRAFQPNHVTTSAAFSSKNGSSASLRLPPKRFPDHFEPGSLYCYALMQPIGYEPGLIKTQYKHRASIFGCEEYAVYSNRIVDIAPGLQTYVVNSSLKCKVGGEFMTALNLDIFLAVWAKVIDMGRYTLHDWTVKVDPDCVFFPSRLHAALTSRQGGNHALYINNCRFGLHGPLEVFSRRAVQAWSAGSQRCQDHFKKLCSGDCKWGEDLFIDQCLMKVLGVERVNDYSLLAEDHCDPEEGWGTCTNQSKIAFHPFKAEQDYLGCLRNGSVHKEDKAFAQ